MAEPSGNVTMDVGEWLRSLGLGQYETAFRDNGVDADVLPDLSDADLEKLGVLLGHRRRLLKAIANPAAPPPLVAPNAQPAPPPVESAERRHLTVMFCDLVGSTSISAKLDAEDWRDLVGGYIDAASAAVTRMGGHVAKKLGDGIMALFGYPLAQENDAERALRAALEIQRALAEINARNANSGRPKLEARIGVETGAVVVDSAGEVFGDAPNVAARVQARGGAGLDLDHREGAAAGRRPVRRRGSRRARAEGRARAGDAVPDRARERRRPALRAARADAAGRARGGS